MDFFSFYREMKHVTFPFEIFRMVHFVILGILLFLIYRLIKYYNHLNIEKQRRFQNYMGMYFFIEESLYTLWLLWRCKQQVWLEILPLQLCSLCAIISVLCVIFKRKELRFFCGVIGVFSGVVAIVYPANIGGLYPVLSYRTINFFILHGAFILFGLMQLKEKDIAYYRNIKACTILLSIIVFSIAFVNKNLGTDYMFIGNPSSINFINTIHIYTGIFFLPTVILVLVLIQFIVLYIYQWCMRHTKNYTDENKCNSLKNI